MVFSPCRHVRINTTLSQSSRPDPLQFVERKQSGCAVVTCLLFSKTHRPGNFRLLCLIPEFRKRFQTPSTATLCIVQNSPTVNKCTDKNNRNGREINHARVPFFALRPQEPPFPLDTAAVLERRVQVRMRAHQLQKSTGPTEHNCELGKQRHFAS
jgi:hypothetical protein